MDIQHLVDRLEDLIDEGRHIPMTKLTMVDEERALEIIDQMRISVPEEVEKANRVINQRDRLMAQANEEAARIVDLAREKSAEAIRMEADNYVLEVLNELEGHLLKTLTVVRNGINKIQQDREAMRERAEAAVQEANAEFARLPYTPSPAEATAALPATTTVEPVEITVDSSNEAII